MGAENRRIFKSKATGERLFYRASGGRNAAKIARPFLEELGLSKGHIEDICYGIAIHVDGKADFEGERTPFAESIGDADNIDRFDAYRIYETLEKGKFSELSYEEKTEKVVTTLEKQLKDSTEITL